MIWPQDGVWRTLVTRPARREPRRRGGRARGASAPGGAIKNFDLPAARRLAGHEVLFTESLILAQDERWRRA